MWFEWKCFLELLLLISAQREKKECWNLHLDCIQRVRNQTRRRCPAKLPKNNSTNLKKRHLLNFDLFLKGRERLLQISTVLVTTKTDNKTFITTLFNKCISCIHSVGLWWYWASNLRAFSVEFGSRVKSTSAHFSASKENFIKTLKNSSYFFFKLVLYF